MKFSSVIGYIGKIRMMNSKGGYAKKFTSYLVINLLFISGTDREKKAFFWKICKLFNLHTTPYERADRKKRPKPFAKPGMEKFDCITNPQVGIS